VTTAGLPLLPLTAGGCLSARAALGGYPFTLGVASGEPLADGFVLWTRLAPRPMEPGGGMAAVPVRVGWSVSEDAAMSRVVASGQALASPTGGHSVHVELHGLKPDRHYWYRFTVGGEASEIGRARTTPTVGAPAERMRFCFTSCQKYEAGFYAGYHHLVEDDPDLILFLGDYIYEGDPGSRQSVRLHQNPEPVDIDGYRMRYATYKSDPLLQAAHAAAPWMVIWDDHEVVNDYGADIDESGDPVAFLRRRAAAYQAYYEHMPLRRRSLPVGPDMQLYRTLNWGRLAQFQLVDNRQYRQPTPCPAPGSNSKLIPDCDARRDPARALLGQRQESWLLETFSNSRARWNLMAQQTLFGPMNLRDPVDMAQVRYSNDGWDGAPATRDRITARGVEASTSNPLVLGGDVHAFAAASVENGVSGPVVASEFVGGSITSLGMDPAVAARIQALNPRMDLFDSGRRGYTRVDVTPARAEMAFRALADARDPASTVSTLAGATTTRPTWSRSSCSSQCFRPRITPSPVSPVHSARQTGSGRTNRRCASSAASRR